MNKTLSIRSDLRSLLSKIIVAERDNGNFQSLKTVDESASPELIRYVSTISKPVSALLGNDPLFSSDNPLMISNGENGASSLNPELTARTLIRRAAIDEDADSPIRWLNKVLSTKSATGFHVMTISDVVVETEVLLDNSVRLVPVDGIPPSRNKAIATNNVSPSVRWLELPGNVTAALVLPAKIDHFFHSDQDEDSNLERDPFRSHNILDKARLALSAVCPSCPVNLGYWFNYEDPDLADATPGTGRMTKALDIQPHQFRNATKIDPNEARKVLNAFFRLDDETISRCLIALDRLNQSIRRSVSSGDKCLDLAMSLESLLVNDSGEHSYKIGLRAALISGKNYEEKLRIRAITKALYEIRSKLVHTGKGKELVKLANSSEKIRAYDLVIEAEQIVSDVIKRVILLGKIPQWFEFEILQVER